jgi:thiamine-phosphate pyrophosphorylase
MGAVVGLGRLHVITDARPGRHVLAVVIAALEAGAPVIQLRAKSLGDRELYELASRVVDECASRDACCIVNDRVDIALAVGATGVHVGSGDLPVPVARDLIGDTRVLGATARDPETARRHEAAGATYLGVGPAFSTGSKDGLPAPLGPEGIARVAAAVSIPVIAVAGVTASRVPELLGAGAFGVAVISAVSEADDPGAATKGLLTALDAAERQGAR